MRVWKNEKRNFDSSNVLNAVGLFVYLFDSGITSVALTKCCGLWPWGHAEYKMWPTVWSFRAVSLFTDALLVLRGLQFLFGAPFD